MIPPPPGSALFPYTTLFRSRVAVVTGASLGIGRATAIAFGRQGAKVVVNYRSHCEQAEEVVNQIKAGGGQAIAVDRKSTRLNSSHANISYAVFCLKKKIRIN